MIDLLGRFWRGIGHLLGYGDGIHPIAPPGPDLPGHQAVGSAGLVLGPFLDALFMQENLPRKILEGRPPLRGREFWPYCDKPKLDEPDVASGWQNLQAEEQACELRTWLESSSCPAVTTSLTHAVLAFQYGKTIIGHRDRCPLPWGPLAYQGVVAAYQTAWLVTACDAGVDDEELDRDRRLLYQWLEMEAPKWQACSGDLVALHCICERLGDWCTVWKWKHTEDHARYKQADRMVSTARKRQHDAWSPYTRLAARSQLTLEYQREHPLRWQRDRSQKALTELEELLARWALLNPLGRIAEKAGAGPETTQTQAGPKLFSPAIVVMDSRARGLQEWLSHEAARQCHLPVSGVNSPLMSGRVLDLLAEIEPSKDIDPSQDEPWQACLFLWRFYRIWTQSRLSLSEIKVLEVQDFQDTDGKYAAFFRPWDRLLNVRNRLSHVKLPEGSCRLEFVREMEEYSRSNNNVLNRAERWQGRMIEMFDEKLQIIRDHLLGVTRVRIHLPQ